jgi:hypothetical protein
LVQAFPKKWWVESIWGIKYVLLQQQPTSTINIKRFCGYGYGV